MSAKSDFTSSLKRLRTERGWSQIELCRRAELAETIVCHYEAGNRLPGLESLIALADAFGCSLDALCGRKGDSRLTAPRKE